MVGGDQEGGPLSLLFQGRPHLALGQGFKTAPGFVRHDHFRLAGQGQLRGHSHPLPRESWAGSVERGRRSFSMSTSRGLW